MQTGHIATYQTIIKAPVEKVWDALTNPELVKQYFFGSDQRGDWRPGGAITWTGEYEGKTYIDKGVIQEYVPNEKLAFTYLSSWSDKEDIPENYLFVTYLVKPIEEGTELTITQTNYDDEKARHSAENWSLVIDGLKKIIE